jgi:hypothetical protein
MQGFGVLESYRKLADRTAHLAIKFRKKGVEQG